VQYPTTRFKPRIWRSLLTLSLLSALLPVGLLSLLWIVADSGGGADVPVDVAQFDSATDLQLDSTITAHAQRINSRLGETEVAVLQMQALAQQILGLPEVFAGSIPDSIPFLHSAPAAANGDTPASQSKPSATTTESAAGTKELPPADDHPLDNPVYYSLSSGGALRKQIDDGHSAVFMMARPLGASFTRHDAQRLFATAAIDPLLAQTTTASIPQAQAYLLTNDSLLRTYPYIDLSGIEDDKDLTALPVYAWSKAKANSRGIVWAGPYLSRFSNQWVVACIAEINVGGQMLGVTGVELPLTSYRESLLSFSVGRGGVAWLMDASGLIIACQEQAPAILGVAALSDAGLPDEKHPSDEVKAQATLSEQSNAALFQQTQQAAQTAAGTATHEDGVFIRAAKLDSTGWILGGYLPSQLIADGYHVAATGDSQMRRMLVWIFGVLIIAVLIAFTASWLEARRIAQPLAILTQQVRQAAISQSATSLVIADDSEIGALAAAMQDLVDRISLQDATSNPPATPSKTGLFSAFSDSSDPAEE
jgi:hypothetical protein